MIQNIIHKHVLSSFTPYIFNSLPDKQGFVLVSNYIEDPVLTGIPVPSHLFDIHLIANKSNMDVIVGAVIRTKSNFYKKLDNLIMVSSDSNIIDARTIVKNKIHMVLQVNLGILQVYECGNSTEAIMCGDTTDTYIRERV